LVYIIAIKYIWKIIQTGGVAMHMEGILKSRQIKAARALLDWSQDDLADASSLSVATIRKLEIGHISPRGQTTRAIRRALEDAGLEFLEPDGVRHRPDEILIYRGKEGLIDFYDDVFNTAKRKSGEIVLVCPNPNVFYADPNAFYKDILKDYRDSHVGRMTQIQDKTTIKCIFTENSGTIETAAYAEYRWISKNYVNPVPFYVYDDKYAVSIVEADSSPKIVVIRSRSVADTFRKQFFSMWEKATPCNNLSKEGWQKSNKRS
jgi:transcriptional regulator with XRE-family HTH domain